MKQQKTPCSFDYPRMILRPDSLYFPWPRECARASARMCMCVHTHTQRVFGAHEDTAWKWALSGLESQGQPMYHLPRRQPSTEKKSLIVP